MADTKRTNVNMDENIKKGKVRKKKRYLKKSVRRTIGALLLVTSLIVAAIPTGNASATTDLPAAPGGTDGEELDIPSLDTIINTGEFYHVDRRETSVAYNDDTSLIYGGFSAISDGKVTIGDREMYIIADCDGKQIDPAQLKPTYMMGQYKTEGNTCLAKYIEGSNLSEDFSSPIVYQYDSVSEKYYTIGDGKVYHEYIPKNDEGKSFTISYYVTEEDEEKDTPEDPKEKTVIYKFVCVEVYDEITDEPPETEYYAPEDNDFGSEEYYEEEIETEEPEYYSEEFSLNNTYLETEVHENEYYGAQLAPILLAKTTLQPEEQVKYENAIPVHTYYGCSNLTSVESIGNSAFEGCSSIQSIAMHADTRLVGNFAFKGCTALNNVVLNEHVTKLGVRAFDRCISLSGIDFKNVKQIGDGAFANCLKLSDVSIPKSIKKIGSGAYYGCQSLRNFDISNTFQLVIGDYMLAKCTQLSQIDFTGAGNIDIKIANLGTPVDNDDKAAHPYGVSGLFAGDTMLNTVIMPNDTAERQLQKDTFLGCNVQTFVVGGNGMLTRYAGENVYTGRNTYAFDKEFGTFNKDLNMLVPIADFEIVGPKPEKPAEDIDGDPKNARDKAYVYAMRNNYPYRFMDKDNEWYYYYQTGGYILKLRQKDGVIFECIETKNVTVNSELNIPNTIGKIAEVSGIEPEVFKGKILKKVVIPASVRYIGYDCFSGCMYLKEVEITTKGTAIGDRVFKNCPVLSKVTFDQALDESMHVIDGESSIGESCFYNCPKLTEINFVDDDFESQAKGISYAQIPTVLSTGVPGIGTDAFRTLSPSLTFTGKMDRDYAPYAFAIDPNGKFNEKQDGFILYRTGNPYNLACQYKRPMPSGSAPNGVYLITFPDLNTEVGHYSESGDVEYVSGLRERYNDGDVDLTDMQRWIVEDTQDIVIPDGIDYVDGAKAEEIGNVSAFQGVDKLRSVTFNGPQKFPNKLFENSNDLEQVIYNKDVIELGDLPFYCIDDETGEKHKNESLSSVYMVIFNDEAEMANVNIDNPAYSNANGIIKSTNKKDEPYEYIVEQILPGRGNIVGEVDITAAELNGVVGFKPEAARDCDSIESITFPPNSAVDIIPEKCFYDCDKLKKVTFPQNRISVMDSAFRNIKGGHDIQIYVPSIEFYAVDDSFEKTDDFDVIFHSYDNSAAKSYAKTWGYGYVRMDGKITIRFFDFDYNVIDRPFVEPVSDTSPLTGAYLIKKYNVPTPSGAAGWIGKDDNLNTYTVDDVLFFDTNFYPVSNTEKCKVTFWVDKIKHDEIPVDYGKTLSYMPDDPVKTGYTFRGWRPSTIAQQEIYDNVDVYAYFTKDEKPKPSPTPTPTPTPTSSAKSSSSKSSSSKSSSSKSSSSGSSSMAYPFYVASQDNGMGNANVNGNMGSPIGSTVYISENPNYGDGNNSGGGSGNTRIESSRDGISDTSKMSATVNGSSDNYVVKISRTQEADDCALAALQNAYGNDIDAIRYLPFDISLYDSTGTNKISPLPDGMTVSITMPIPDDLAIYGGNSKVASTVGGQLENIQPKFTMINGVPCMNYTVSHLSPYLVYVDTNNLTEAGISDATPKTADPIHPKWFLCIGLAAIAIVMLIKRDPEDYMKKVRA